MTTTSTFIGIGDNQRISSRVLKPPGGGSTISFGDDGDYDIKRKSTPVQDDPKKNAQQSPKAESDGKTSSQTNEENGCTSLKHSPSSGSSTPNYSKLDTQGRLFGEESQDYTNRKVRDHQRSRIFSDADEKMTAKLESPIISENKGDKILKQKQRVPPGGVSSKLW